MKYAEPLSTTSRNHLCAALEGLARCMGVKPSKVTNILAGDAKLYYRVAEGGGFTVATYDRVMGAVSAVWPEDVPWPSDVPRLPPGDVAEDRAEMIRSLIAAARAPQQETEHG